MSRAMLLTLAAGLVALLFWPALAVAQPDPPANVNPLNAPPAFPTPPPVPGQSNDGEGPALIGLILMLLLVVGGGGVGAGLALRIRPERPDPSGKPDTGAEAAGFAGAVAGAGAVIALLVIGWESWGIRVLLVRVSTVGWMIMLFGMLGLIAAAIAGGVLYYVLLALIAPLFALFHVVARRRGEPAFDLARTIAGAIATLAGCAGFIAFLVWIVQQAS